MLKQINNLISKTLFSVAVLIFVSFFITNKIEAASLSLIPSSATVSVGNIVSLKISVDTAGKFVNTAEVIMQFPKDLLDVISITKNSSIFTLWVEEPNFSNNTGTITFNGGVPTPGFNGQRGDIVTITFKAKKQGTASVFFSDGAVRENDGEGTDILTKKSGATVTIVESPKEEVKVPVKTPVSPVVPVKKNDVVVSIFNPSIRFEGIQGILKLSDEKNIDEIDYYMLAIDDGASFKIKKDQLINYEYYLPILNSGSHVLNIVSFDKTGKYKEYALSFLSPDISVPILSLSANEINKNDFVVISGKTDYPNNKVNIILELNGKEIKRYEQKTGTDGSFLVTTDKIKDIGNINIWAENVFSETVKSSPSERVYLRVNEMKFIRITLAIFYPLLWLILIFIIISLLIILLYLGWYKFFSLKKRVNSESKKIITEVHKAMLLIKDELSDQLKSLERIKKDRVLNDKEEDIFDEIEKNIDGVDDFIEKKLKNLK